MRLIKNKKRIDPRYFLHENRGYRRLARAWDAPDGLEDYGTLLTTVIAAYGKLANERGTPSEWPEAITTTIIPALDAEEARSDNMSEDEILINAEKMVPTGQGTYTMMETPLAKEAIANVKPKSGDQAGLPARPCPPFCGDEDDDL